MVLQLVRVVVARLVEPAEDGLLQHAGAPLALAALAAPAVHHSQAQRGPALQHAAYSRLEGRAVLGRQLQPRLTETGGASLLRAGERTTAGHDGAAAQLHEVARMRRATTCAMPSA